MLIAWPVFQESIINSSFTSAASVKTPALPITGFDASEPKNVTLPSVLKLRFVYSPIIPPPALKTASDTAWTASFGVNTIILFWFSFEFTKNLIFVNPKYLASWKLTPSKVKSKFVWAEIRVMLFFNKWWIIWEFLSLWRSIFLSGWNNNGWCEII